MLLSGRFLDETMRAERVTRSEVLASIRQAGMGQVDRVAAVVLETDGSMSVLPSSDLPLTSQEDVDR